jgi:hypothetical protein
MWAKTNRALTYRKAGRRHDWVFCQRPTAACGQTLSLSDQCFVGAARGRVRLMARITEEIQTFLDFPPMRRGASFNLDAVKAEMSKRMAEAERASKGPSQ